MSPIPTTQLCAGCLGFRALRRRGPGGDEDSHGCEPVWSRQITNTDRRNRQRIGIHRLTHGFRFASVVSTDVLRFAMLIPHGFTPVADLVARRAMMLGG